MRKAIALGDDGRVTARVEAGELRLVTPTVVVQQIQARMRKYKKPGESIVDQFLADRRAMWGEERASSSTRTLKPAGAGLDRERGFEFPLDRRHVFELIEQGTGGVDGAPVRPGCAFATVDKSQEPVEAAEHATHLQEFDGVAQVRIVDLDEIFGGGELGRTVEAALHQAADTVHPAGALLYRRRRPCDSVVCDAPAEGVHSPCSTSVVTSTRGRPGMRN